MPDTETSFSGTENCGIGMLDTTYTLQSYSQRAQDKITNGSEFKMVPLIFAVYRIKHIMNRSCKQLRVTYKYAVLIKYMIGTRYSDG